MIQLPSRQALAKRLTHLSIGVAAASLVVLHAVSPSAQAAEACTRQCETGQIRFMPGQPITIEFINRTDGTVNLERVLDIDMHWLRPHTDFSIQTLVGVDDDMSLVFWDDNNRAVEARLHRPDSETLQVELLPSGHDSDRAVHVSNDGRVLVY